MPTTSPILSIALLCYLPLASVFSSSCAASLPSMEDSGTGSTTVDCHQQVEQVSRSSRSMAVAAMAERKPRPKPEKKVDCPRCNSPSTKFCYYNNYSTSQPRYFCRACRRHWTHGGSLRNVPIGGGCRKNRRADANNSNNSKLVAMAFQEPMVRPPTCMGFPNVLPTFISSGFELRPSFRDCRQGGFAPSVATGGTTSFLDLLRGGFLDGGGGYGGGAGSSGMVHMPPAATAYAPPLQHAPIGGAAAEEGGVGDDSIKTMTGVQWPHLTGGSDVGDVGSPSRDSYRSNGGWQNLLQ